MVEEKTFTAKLKVIYAGKNKLRLHKQIGEGKMPDGRKCRLIMDNHGVFMEVSNKKDEWEHYWVSWMNLSEAIAHIIPTKKVE